MTSSDGSTENEDGRDTRFSRVRLVPESRLHGSTGTCNSSQHAARQLDSKSRQVGVANVANEVLCWP